MTLPDTPRTEPALPAPDRRGFLRLAATVSAALIAAIASVPVLGSVLAPLLTKRMDSGGFLSAVPLVDLLVGVPKRVNLVGTVVDGWTRSEGTVGAVWLLKDASDQVRALSTVCPHSGCSINFPGKDTFSCPCHASSFSLDGSPLSGPSPRPMDPLSVEVREQQVFVRYARFKQGSKDRRET